MSMYIITVIGVYKQRRPNSQPAFACLSVIKRRCPKATFLHPAIIPRDWITPRATAVCPSVPSLPS